MTKAKKLDNKFEATMKACRSARIDEVNSRVRKTKKLKEEEELPATDIDVDIDADDEDPEGTVDDIMVVTDPDLTVDEYEDTLDDLQSIVDDTPDGEVPFTDEYIGDQVYACPVCGNNFFSDTEMEEGDVCPVCGEEADGFVLVGEVQDTDDVADEDEDIDTDDEELDVDVDIDADEDEFAESKVRKAKARFAPSQYTLSEKTLNPFLTKFIKENYRNAVSMTAKRAILSGRNLKIECAIKFKSGKIKKSVITVENFKPSKKMKMFGKADEVFKVESKKSAPFMFEATMVGKDLRFTGMKYSFITKKEGKRLQVSGKYALKESKKK